MEKNIFLSLHILSHSPLRDARQKVKAGNWKQELKEKPWMNATIGLFIHDLNQPTFLYIPPFTPDQSMTPLTVNWALPHLSQTQKIPTGLSYRGIFWIAYPLLR